MNRSSRSFPLWAPGFVGKPSVTLQSLGAGEGVEVKLRPPLGAKHAVNQGHAAPFSSRSMKNSISIALSKGRIFDETAPLLARAGLRPQTDPKSRKLVIDTNREGVRLVIVRASDTPTYVQHGAADIGIAGRDVLHEHGGAGLYQPLDLRIATCRMIVAVRQGFDYDHAVRIGARLRVATKYVRIAREHFAQKGVHVDLIRLYGSMELAPITNLADAIVDLVSSGNTLKANNLVAVEDVMQVSARLIVNQAALKTRRAVLQPMIDAFARAAGASK